MSSTDLFVVTPPSLHLQPRGRRLLVASRRPEVTAAVVEGLHTLWPDEQVALYLWEHAADDATAWLLHHLGYCDTVILDLSDHDDLPLMLLLAGSRLGDPGLFLIADGDQGERIAAAAEYLHPNPIFPNGTDLVRHLASTGPHRPGDGHVR